MKHKTLTPGDYLVSILGGIFLFLIVTQAVQSGCAIITP
jgi:hypothetical protein